MTLLRRAVVLDIEPPLPNDRYVSAAIGAPDTLETPVLYMERAAWEDLGAPATVTCTIEPGDRLNTVPDPCD